MSEKRPSKFAKQLAKRRLRACRSIGGALYDATAAAFIRAVPSLRGRESVGSLGQENAVPRRANLRRNAD